MPFATCLGCGASLDRRDHSPLPPTLHLPGCPVLEGACWTCGCEGEFCAVDCDDRWLLPDGTEAPEARPLVTPAHC
jgi:hypothetical protein